MTKPHTYLHITGGIGAALLPFAFPWLSPVYGLIIMALGVMAAGKKYFRFALTLVCCVYGLAMAQYYLERTQQRRLGRCHHGFAHHRDGCFDACRATQ